MFARLQGLRQLRDRLHNGTAGLAMQVFRNPSGTRAGARFPGLGFSAIAEQK